tara:strand:- start:875 stop:1525 length:651 start_codon:yes stop_codon:yes gene_type:complete
MIAKEGRVVLVPIVLVCLVGTLISTYYSSLWLDYINYFNYIFLLFSLYFFRNPNREILGESHQMISPADGKVIQIIDVDDADIGKAKQISIFLSVFNVHSQYVPLDCKVLSSVYNPGKFLIAYNHKTSTDNEQTVILFESKNKQKFKIKQIAGLIARRILNYMEQGKQHLKGDKLGFIRFGSRVEIIVPESSFDIFVKNGDIVRSNITIIGEFKNC